MFKRTDTIEAHFHRINGLQSGAPVALSGVNIGAIDSISFPDDPHADYVIVRMWIIDANLSRIRVNAIAEINTMGLLGDKFVEITGGDPNSPAIEPGQVLASQDPIDYQALLQKQGTSDMIANVMEISQSLRSILDSIDKGHGLLSELVKGEPNGAQPPLTLADLRKTFDNMNKLAAEMDVMLEKINRGQGLAGAMFSDKTNGQELLAQVKGAAISMKETSEKMNQLVDRFNNGNGAVQRLISDQQYANQLLSNMQTSLADMKDILHKINDGKGSVGLAVNDPSLYYEAKSFLSGGGSLGWGVKMLNGAYTVTHPFSRNSPTDELILTPAPSSQSAPANQAPPKP
jgi:phospholipid/cholesterol/gamma-HCH transport system substrate-binding protein